MFDARFWLPPSINALAEGSDAFFMALIWVSAVSLALTLGTMLWLVIRYRSNNNDVDRTAPPEHNLALEAAWTLIPTVILVAVFFWGAKGYTKMAVPPSDALEIRATGQKWYWTFDYPTTGVRIQASRAADAERKAAGEPQGLVVPVNKAIKVVGSSSDVIHSFYVPAFRVKKDMLPNRYTVATFQATEEGVYDLFCAEYCGTDHSRMITKVTVVSQTAFDSFMKAKVDEATIPLTGAQLFARSGCAGCHAIDSDKAGIGPSLLGLSDREQRLTNGKTIRADDNYIRESIVNPMSKVVDGYNPVMPSYAAQLSESELTQLILYLRDPTKKDGGAL